MKQTQYFIFLIFLLVANIGLANDRINITNYHQTFVPCHDQQDQLLIAIRLYYVDTTPYFLLVNPYNFSTQIMAAKLCAPSKNIAVEFPYHYHAMQALQATPFMQALNRYTSPPYKLQNDGVTHAEHSVDGMFLTADLCPSRKPFAENFFNALVAMADKNQRPVPIGLSISGMWLLGHEKEFAWLVQQQKNNKLQITWINHSFSHLYYNDLPLKNNFLLTKQTSFVHEVLDTEKLLLENKQLPSVFFRFPGLISNKKTILELQKLNLIPVGSDAWLAKGQPATAGSIILVHGNGNEPEGIALVMPILQQADLHLLPLSQIFSNYSAPDLSYLGRRWVFSGDE